MGDGIAEAGVFESGVRCLRVNVRVYSGEPPTIMSFTVPRAASLGSENETPRL